MTTSTAANVGTLSDRGRLWMMIAIVLGLLGAGVSVYAIQHHIAVKASGQTDAACNISERFNCDAAALSQYSEIAGIPLGVWGLGYFAAMIVLAGLALLSQKSSREHHVAYVALVFVGLATSVVLGLISWQSVGSFCPTCIAIYGLTAAQAIVWFVFRKESPSLADGKALVSGGMSAAIAVAVVVAAFSLLRSSLMPSAPVVQKPTELAPAIAEIPVSRSPYAGLGEDYRKGPDTASVVIVEFVDFQCPACRSMAPILDTLVKDFPGRVQAVFRNYPLSNTCNAGMQGNMHDQACQAAVMARCAGQYGKFWEYHDLLFNNQRQISEANMKGWAKEIGLSDEQINACWDNKDLLAKVKDDADLGNKLNVDSTPTIFINGRKVNGGRGLDDLRLQIQQLLN